MKALRLMIFWLPCIMQTPDAVGREIDDFYTSLNQCDYLVFSPRIFQEGAEAFTGYRNSFTGDDVIAAKYVILEKLYEQAGTPERSPDSIILASISWALSSWQLPPSYIVFLGDDSIVCREGTLIPRNRGPMPSHPFDCTMVSRRNRGV
jgi:hypothetical protein